MISDFDETPKDPTLVKYQTIMASDLRRLLKLIYQLSEIITWAMMTDDYFGRTLELDKAKRRKVVERVLSTWSKLSTLRMRVNAPMLQADHLDLWEVLDDLRLYASSTHEAFLPVVADHCCQIPLVEELDVTVIYNATDYFCIFEKLLREDVEALEELLAEIVSQTHRPTGLQKIAALG
jgi:hypothetical protein